MDNTVATIQPIGQETQIPMLPNRPAIKKARTTRSTKSTKVAVIKCFISPDPLSTPSAISFAATTK